LGRLEPLDAFQIKAALGVQQALGAIIDSGIRMGGERNNGEKPLGLQMACASK